MSKIIPAIQSRCTRFRFGPLQAAQILPRLDHVISQERLRKALTNYSLLTMFFIFFSVNVTEDGRQALLSLAHGDMRRVLNILQSTSMAFNVVSEDNVYTCVGHPLKSDIANVATWLLNEDFTAAYSSMQH